MFNVYALPAIIASSIAKSAAPVIVLARYWRIFGARNYSDNSTPAISAAEIEMRGVIGGSDLTTGGTPYSDSTFSGSFPASNAFDANGTTFWVSQNVNPGTHWIAYDFVTDVEIVEISYSKRPDSFGRNEAIITGLVQYSHDNANWTTYWVFTTPATWSTGAETRVFTKAPIPDSLSWRIRTIQTQLSNQRQSFAKVEFRLTPGGIDQAVGGTAISASAFSGEYLPANAFDGTSSNYVSSGFVVSNAPQWIGYEFTETKDINEVMIKVRSDAFGANEGTISAVVESSFDSFSWQEEWSFITPGTWLNNSTEERVFTRPGPFPYTFPLRSIDASTGSSTHWTQVTGNMFAQGGTGPNWVLEDDGNDRAYVYQEFVVGPDHRTAIDAGNTFINLSTYLDTIASDDDGAVGFVEFYDDSSGFLGKVFTPDSQSDPAINSTLSNARVPPGTRILRIGWQAANHTGTELSAYVRDLQCIIDEDTVTPWNDVVLVFAERDANLTGWVFTSGAMTVGVSNSADYEWASVGFYNGGSTAFCSGYKNFVFPEGWGAKVAAGSANFLLRCGVHNANNDDDVTVTVRLNNGSTNPTFTSGRIAVRFQMGLVQLTGAIPADTTSIDIVLTYDRVDGTVNDGAVDTISLILYETAV